MKAKPFFTGYRANLRKAATGILVAPGTLVADVDWRAVLDFVFALVVVTASILLYPIAVFVWPVLACYNERCAERAWQRHPEFDEGA